MFLEKFYLQTQGTALGANFAPCYANITLGHWEELCIWHNNPFSKHIAFFGCYIDDVHIIWSGTVEEFKSFVSYCNDNSFGLTFTHVIDPLSFIFLDLELTHERGTIITKNFCK